MKAIGDSQLTWWILMIVGIAVAAAMTALIVSSDGRNGNWFTVVGAGCTIVISISSLLRIRKARRRGPS